jgi:predicted secreted protein
MDKILVVSHCILNISSKVIGYNEMEQREETEHRRGLMEYVRENNIQLLQLPCPEFLMYGASRWGHVKEQFDHPFYRKQCREMLEPVMMQLKEYASYPERFALLGIVAIDHSPSCGFHATSKGDWGGELGGCPNLMQKLESLTSAEEPGVFMEELIKLLHEAQLEVPILDLSSF